MNMNNKLTKRGQVALFVIIALVIVAAIVLVIVFKDRLFGSSIPTEFAPVYNLYGECIEQQAEDALEILSVQGGHIDVGEYEVPSEYAPFSSHLDFLGIQVPYWYYVSGNNLIKENVPTRSSMEQEMEDYIAEHVGECDFEEYYAQGFWIEMPEEGDVDVNVDINDNSIDINVRANVLVSREDRSAKKSSHEVVVESKLGKNYNIAKEVYDKEAESAFLEEYAVDTLRLYAPVDGVEISCGPKIWQTRELVEELHQGLEANMGAIKVDGNYYRLDDKEDDYFVVSGLNVDEPVRFLYSSNWPSKIEITGDGVEQELIVAEPVGTQEGLGIMGFCYVPYHYVYDVSFPVLVQVGDGLEMFQFPVAVVIDNNVPKEADLSSFDDAEGQPEIGICKNMLGDANIYTFDTNLNPVSADVSYKCFDETCRLGTTEISGSDAYLQTEIPLCLNGQLIVRASGFAEKKQLYSSNSQSSIDVILDREYGVSVEVKIGGRELADDEIVVVQLVGEDGDTKSAVFPSDIETLELSEGSYDVTVYVYGGSRVVIPGSTSTECVDVTRGGLLGLFGSTKEECFEIEIPETTVDHALIGGGNTETYILESELSEGRMIINAGSLPRADSLEQLQYNQEAFDGLEVYLTFA